VSFSVSLNLFICIIEINLYCFVIMEIEWDYIDLLSCEAVKALRLHNAEYLSLYPNPNLSRQVLSRDTPSWVSPKGPWVEGLFLMVALLTGVEALRGEAYWEEVRSLEVCPWRGLWDPSFFLSFFFCSMADMSQTVVLCYVLLPWCTVLPRLKATGPTKHGLKPWAKITLFPSKSLISYTLPQRRKVN
jgi:hypothetical protein